VQLEIRIVVVDVFLHDQLRLLHLPPRYRLLMTSVHIRLLILKLLVRLLMLLLFYLKQFGSVLENHMRAALTRLLMLLLGLRVGQFYCVV